MSDIKHTIEEQVCPKCGKKTLKHKRYFMFSRVCENDGTVVPLPNLSNQLTTGVMDE